MTLATHNGNPVVVSCNANTANTNNLTVKAKTDAVAFAGLTANGTSKITTTTELTITFDKAVTGLAADDFTVTGEQKVL